ncbi:hypothetical protein [Crassaminicella profunda]|uniref:hypothetical protein n=1 Tax=Crassaminicella profunda TaxID=1286698 RepID=UPI001CA6FFC5|nr:hypothetical protein [Crassaminicella profunda]QZY56535.1 hypothetical protein K7H06_06320 [Crassaminicella profunda]
MSRVERKNLNKKNKKRSGRKCICMLFMFFILINGILIVDDSFRMMMMIEEPKVFDHKKINEQVHEICFCGENFYIDEQKIYTTYESIRNEVQDCIEILKEKKKVICKER